MTRQISTQVLFQSTQPSQAVTDMTDDIVLDVVFQSTQPSQAVTGHDLDTGGAWHISIHTALAGCDVSHVDLDTRIVISIHTALAGCDAHSKFHIDTSLYFNPHSPRRL